MSLPLEDTIMREIGLGNYPNWYNGSGSCSYIRKAAARQLAAAIQKHHDVGEPIMPPNQKLIDLVIEYALGADDSEYSLTRTWEIASDAIRAHMSAHATNGGSKADTIFNEIFYYYVKRLQDLHADRGIEKRLGKNMYGMLKQ